MYRRLQNLVKVSLSLCLLGLLSCVVKVKQTKTLGDEFTISLAYNSIYIFGGEIIFNGTDLTNVNSISVAGSDCPISSSTGTEIKCLAPAATLGTKKITISGNRQEQNAYISYKDFSRVITLAGDGTKGSVDGPGNTATIGQAINDFVLDGNLLYFADGTERRIRKLDLSSLNSASPSPSQVSITTISGTGASGLLDGDDATATYQQTDGLYKIDNNLYLLDTNWEALDESAIRMVNLNTNTASTKFATTEGERGFGDLIIDSTAEYAYAGDCQVRSTIRRIRLSDNTFSDFVGNNGTWSSTDGTGTGATLNCPWGLAWDKTKENFYVTEWGSGNIRKVNIATTQVTTIAGTGVLGDSDHPTNPLLAQLNRPGKLVFINNYLLVAEQASCKVKSINLLTGEVKSLMFGGCTTTNGSTTTASVNRAMALEYHPHFGIFIGSSNWATTGGESLIRLMY